MAFNMITNINLNTSIFQLVHIITGKNLLLKIYL